MIASTALTPRTTQAQGGNPLLPFIGAGQANVGGNIPTDPNNVTCDGQHSSVDWGARAPRESRDDP